MLDKENEFSFKSLFIPFTTLKAIHWIIFIGLIVFINSLFNGFVGDDTTQIVNNQAVHSLQNIFSYFTSSTFYNGGSLVGIYFKPIQTVVFSLIYSFLGSNPLPFHLLQLVLHITNAIFVFMVFKRFFSKELSFLLSVIFLIHPINSETVYYVSAMQDVLFFFFGIVALWIFINFFSKKSFVHVAILLLFSLLSKETGALFIVITFLYAILFRRGKLLFLTAALSLDCFIYFLLRTHAVNIFANSASPIGDATIFTRLVNVPQIIEFYLQTFIFPINLASSYQWVYKQVNFSHFFCPLIVDVLCFSLMFYVLSALRKSKQIKSSKIFVFFGSWFIVGLLLHLQIISLDATVAERWFYFPIVGLIGMCGISLELFHVNSKDKWFIAIFILLIILLSIRTFIRGFDWKDEFTLDTHDIKVSQNSYDLENGIGSQLILQNKLGEATVHVEKSIQLYPNVMNYLNLGIIYLNVGEYKKSEIANIKALSYGDYYLVYENLAILTLVSDNPNKGIKFIRSVLNKFPQDGKLWFYLAILEYKMKDMTKAQEYIKQAYKFDQSEMVVQVYNSIIKRQPINLKLSR